MMNEEVEEFPLFPVCLLTSAVLPCSFDDRDEDGSEFVALGAKWLQFGRWDDFSLDEEFEPIGGLIRAPARPLRAGRSASLSHSVRLFQFPKRIAAFRNEFGFAPAAMCFPIVRSDGRCRAEQLFAQYLGYCRFRETSE